VQLPESAFDIHGITAKLLEEKRLRDQREAEGPGQHKGASTVAGALVLDSSLSLKLKTGLRSSSRRLGGATAKSVAVGKKGKGGLSLVEDDDEGAGDGKGGSGESQAEEDWVQCDQCGRWRKLPPRHSPLYPQSLPDRYTVWVCPVLAFVVLMRLV